MAKFRIDPPELTAQEIQRFWTYVDKTPGQGPTGDCWRWTRCIINTGYGMFRPQERGYLTHRISFYLANGRWPKVFVCHKCDWRPCCNPAHLFEGDSAANMQDAKSKGRTTQGERDAMSKLTANQVLEIRALAAAGAKQTSIAKQFGIGDAAVSFIVNRLRWKHI